MSIEIIWHKDSLHFLNKLDNNFSNRIVEKVKDIRLNPERYISSLVDMGVSKIRVGDYRLFVNYHHNEKELIIHSIKHRKNAYKK
jgi:mRNA-degrading endonuclease RelE of RelBE toxin-antitoxin system